VKTQGRKYDPVVVVSDSRCRFDILEPRRDLGATLHASGVFRLGINQLKGTFIASSSLCETHLLHLTLEGEILCEADEKPLLAKKGEMIISPANTPHQLKMTTPFAKVAWIHLHQNAVQWAFLEAEGRHVKKMFSLDRFGSVMEGLLETSLGVDERREELLDHYSHILFILLSQELNPHFSPMDRNIQLRLLTLWKKVRENPTHEWSIKSLAQEVHLSKGYLPEVCRRHFGLTPMEKVRTIRMSLAKGLLKMTSLSLENVALRVGYSNEYAFSDAFKKVFKIRPGKFRRD